MEWAAISWELPAGILILAIGGELLVIGAASIARHLRVSSVFIGITLVGFGTSMPELVTSIRAALLELPGIAVGNAIGSNTANILLVLGLAALIYPISTPHSVIRRTGLVVVAATAICIAVVIFGHLDRTIGAALVALLLAYFAYSYFQDGDVLAGSEDQGGDSKGVGRAWFFALVGIALVLLGARWLVDSSIELARHYAVSETIIGLTVVAIGTSLPELITSMMAARRKETGIALGNVLGSNIQNIFGILGITAIVHPITVPPEIIRFDIWVMAAATLALIVVAISNWRISRLEGLLFFLAYVAYVGYLAYLALPMA